MEAKRRRRPREKKAGQSHLIPTGRPRRPRVATLGPGRPVCQATRKRPNVANVGRLGATRRRRYALADNLPRSVFRNRDSLPCALISRNTSAVKRSLRSLATGTDPQFLLRHVLDHLLGAQRLLGFGQHLGRRIDRAELLDLLLLRCSGFGLGLRRIGPWPPSPSPESATSSSGVCRSSWKLLSSSSVFSFALVDVSPLRTVTQEPCTSQEVQALWARIHPESARFPSQSTTRFFA